MKAGILEFPDIFVVNKSDLGAAARRTASELRGGVSLGERSHSRPDPTVILASARDGDGIRELVSAIDAHRQHQLETDSLCEKRLRGRETQLLQTLERRYGSFGMERLGGQQTLLERVRADGSMSTVALLGRLGREIEDALQKPR
jgi:LAO/AO transport system kinase